MPIIVKNGFQYCTYNNEQLKELTLAEYTQLESKGLLNANTVYCVTDYNDVCRADDIIYNDINTKLNVNNLQESTEKINDKIEDFFNLFTFQSFYRDNVSVAKSSTVTFTFDITKEGYTPIGVLERVIDNASTSGSQCSYMTFVNFDINIENNTLDFCVRNYSSSAGNVLFRIKVLYIKNEYYDKYKPTYVTA